MVRSRDLAVVVRRQRRLPQDQFLDLRGEYVDAADDHHVVGPAGNLLHPAHAARGGWQQAGEIARAVTDDRQRFLGQRREHEFAHLAVGHRRAGLGVDDLRIEMIFPDARAVLALDAFAGDARTDYFGEAIYVERVDCDLLLDFGAHRLGPRLGAENADAQRRRCRIDSLPPHFLGDRQHVRRRDHDDVGPEVLNQLHLALGHAARHRDHRAAHPFGAVMRAEAAGEQAIAVGDVHDVAGAPAGGADRTRDEAGPHLDVVAGIPDDGRLAGRP